MSELRPVEPLDSKRHKTDQFDCGQPNLDRWLRGYAGQSQRHDVARTFVVADEESRVVGYYTLVAAEVEHGAASPAVRAGVSRHFPISVCLIARLAVPFLSTSRETVLTLESVSDHGLYSGVWAVVGSCYRPGQIASCRSLPRYVILSSDNAAAPGHRAVCEEQEHPDGRFSTLLRSRLRGHLEVRDASRLRGKRDCAGTSV